MTICVGEGLTDLLIGITTDTQPTGELKIPSVGDVGFGFAGLLHRVGILTGRKSNGYCDNRDGYK